ncbi:MAG TPA: alpha/beta hydrolase [Dongiaceae bacterium]|nr:alpha/beta hydrolase [Dongiaceae bacterium]
MLDPDIAAFAADQEETFDQAFSARPIGEQRALYEAFWRRYHAPRPAGVTATDFSILGLSGHIPVRLYRSAKASSPAPVIVYCHGGSWMFGGLDSHDLPAARLALHSEAAILAVDYRLAPEHKYPAALHDAWDVLNWVVEDGRERDLDPRRVAVAGDSAGGALSAGMALMARDRGGPLLRAQGLIYPALRVTRPPIGTASPGLDEVAVSTALNAYLSSPRDAEDPYAMPLMARDFSRLPPAVICAAELDVVLPDALEYAASLEAVGVPQRLIVAHGLPHTFLRALHFCGGAERAFTDFGHAMAELLQG